MVAAMRTIAHARRYRALIACVRPTMKDAFSLIPIDDYARWTRADGEPFDPWIRVHVRAGGRIVRGSARSMTMVGTVGEWQEWTGLEFPGSGSYVIPGAAAPVQIDVAADLGTYFDPNVWIVHEL
jgi:hypothetical protein